ncbi:MAG: sugar kinase, partial [Chloroflexota bacterium]
VAVGLARLGRRVAYIGRVGADGFGLAILRRLRAEEVDVAGLVTDEDARSGLLVRERRTLGPSEVVYHRAGSAGSRLNPRDVRRCEDVIRRARWLHVTGITPALSDSASDAVREAVAIAAEAAVPVSLDINYRSRLWSADAARLRLAPLLARADVVFGDLAELAVAAGSPPAAAVATILAAGAKVVVVKEGSHGASHHAPDRPVSSAPAVSVDRVVDPIGAGDAFCAGYLAATLDGAGPATALAWGCACGAAAIAAEGDMEGLPTLVELERLLAGGETAAADVIR